MAETVWLDRAHDEFARAQRDFEAEDDTATLQHACQAVECALKAVIYSENRDLPDERSPHDYHALQSHANAHLGAHASIIEELDGVYDTVMNPNNSHEFEDLERVMDEVEAVVDYAETYVTP